MIVTTLTVYTLCETEYSKQVIAYRNCIPILLYDKLACSSSSKMDSYLPITQYYKEEPTICNGNGMYYPWGVTVDYESDNIYVSSQTSNTIQVFDSKGVYLYKFGANILISPLGIAISHEKIFVSQFSPNGIIVFNIEGEFISQFCSPETANQMAHGIAVNEANGDLYVCNISRKSVQIYSDEYLYKSHFADWDLTPSDVKVTKRYICVLSHLSPYFRTFDFNFTEVLNLIPNSICKHLGGPNGFAIDGAGNYIISNFTTNVVIIFDIRGNVLHKLSRSVDRPVGIALNSEGRILVVGHNSKLLIF